MRIAVFTDNDFNKVNGVSTTLRALLRCTPPTVHVRIYTADQEGADEPGYLSLRAVGTSIPFYRDMKVYFPSPAPYLRRLRADRVDLIHMTTPGPLGVIALFAAWRLGIRVVGSFHTDLATYASLLSRSTQLGTVVGKYLGWAYGRCERVLVPSQATSAIIEAGGIAADKHVIWRRGVDADLFSPARRSASLRRRWHADEETAIVMYVGRVSREKNLAAFGAVDEQLARCGVPYRLVFVGGGPMRPEIEQRFPHAVVTGSIPHDQVGQYLASADVFAFPSRTDTAGNVVLEAQAAGLPVVIGDEGGPRENVWAGRSALVTDARDDCAFAAAVERLVRDRALRLEMGGAARAFAQTRDWPSSFAPLFATYRALTTPEAAAPAMQVMRALPGDPLS
jgi:glycosyltransferase involved in cell wall biosynthesis